MALTVNTNIKNDADGYLLDAKSVKGSYVVVTDTTERDNLYSATAITGTKVYVVSESKEYRKTDSGWEEISTSSGGEGTTNYNDLTNKPTLNGTTIQGAMTIDVPDALSDLTDDSTHRVVTDTEKETWNSKQDALTDSDKQAIADLHSDKVTSVNGQTGDITISQATKLSELTDDETHRVVTDEQISAWNTNTPTASGLTVDQVDTMCDILLEAVYGESQVANIEALRTSLKSGSSAATLSSISATYTGGDVNEGTSTSSLSGLTVTATYSDGTSKTVTGYSLSPSSISAGTNTITVTYGGKTTTFTVTGISTRTLTSISATYSGGSVDEGTEVSALSGIVVTGHYSDDTTETITSGYDLSPSTIVLGENTITVDYNTLTTTFTVTGVAPRELSSISVTYSGGKVNASTMTQSDLTGIVVTANYSDGTSAQVTGYTLSPTDGFTSGENTVYVTYGGKTATFTVTAYALESISAVANTTEYTVGTDASALDLTVTATYDDSTSETVTGWTATGTVAEGENTFTIEYGGKSTTVTVTGAGSSVADLEIVASASGFHSSGATLDADTGDYAAGTATGTDTDVLVYALPSKVDITPYSKMVVSLSTSATVAIDGSMIWFYSDAASYKTGTAISNCADQTVEIGGSTEFAIPSGAVAFKMGIKRYTNYPYVTIVLKA